MSLAAPVARGAEGCGRDGVDLRLRGGGAVFIGNVGVEMALAGDARGSQRRLLVGDHGPIAGVGVVVEAGEMQDAVGK